MKNWIIQQQWSDVLFVNWRVDPAQIQSLVPFDLDLFEGDAVISVVPFFMSGIRFPWTPSVPWLSELWELNLRTYVVCNGVPGIYFFTLDTSHRIGNLIARSCFKLPYRYARIQCKLEEPKYLFQSVGGQYRLSFQAEWSEEEVNDSLQKWITERYHLFIRQGARIIRGDVEHERWKVRKAMITSYSGNFSEQYGIKLNSSPSSVYYSIGLKVRFSPFILL